MNDFKKKLQDEITVLEYEYLVELPKEILKARAHGDLSENAEYHACKDRQGFLNARIGQHLSLAQLGAGDTDGAGIHLQPRNLGALVALEVRAQSAMAAGEKCRHASYIGAQSVRIQQQGRRIHFGQRLSNPMR